VLVAGGHQFLQVSAGSSHTCGVTTDYRAWCWGLNGGALGDGTTADRRRPVAVAGGHRFRTVEAGYRHTCGVSYPDNLAWCWGDSPHGELGDGTQIRRLVPVAVMGGRRFIQVSAGESHSCGLTPGGEGFCWGWNSWGQLGDGTEAVRRVRPVAVAGGRAFRQIDAGSAHTCAVTPTDGAFCWGSGEYGQTGNGQTTRSFWPRAVSGTLAFARVTAGGAHTCGQTTANEAYCWGNDNVGQIGDGTMGPARTRPVAVLGGRSFAQLTTGYLHTCGRTLAGAAYCWGEGFFGQLGNGTSSFGAESSRPVRVLGPV